MKLLSIDAETYYSQEYSLTKMMTQQYIEDPRFQEIMWAAGNVDGGGVGFGVGRADKMLQSIDWSNTGIVAHNAQFDASILDQHHDIQPTHVICTMGMARALGVHKITGSVSLANLAVFFGVGNKGTEVVQAKGMRLEDFSLPQLQAYKGYNIKDVELTAQIFNIMRACFDDEELLWNSMVNKMFSCPHLELNTPRLKDELVSIIERREAQQQALANDLGLASTEEVKKHLGSNPKFAELLSASGIEPPMKVSPTTGKDTFAFAKTDQGFIALLESPSARIRLLAETRLGVKSNSEQTRIERLILLSELPSGKFRIPHKVSGAHTHRLSGTDGLNIQNFSSGRIEGQSKTARQAIKLDGSYISAPDSGQIEVRILSFIADDRPMLKVFADGDCPYSQMGSDIYHIPPATIKSGAKAYGGGDAASKHLYMKRQAGKASMLSLGFGTGAGGLFKAMRDVYRVEGITELEAARVHGVYREARPAVVDIWERCEEVLESLAEGGSGYFGGADGRLFYFTARHKVHNTLVPGILLPNGTWLTYPKLYSRKGYKPNGEPSGYTEFAYFKDLRKLNNALAKCTTPAERREVGYKHGSRIWFGTLIENLCQALAFAVLKWQGIRMAQVMPVLFNVHDEFIIADSTANGVMRAEQAKAIMESSPPWLAGLKFECEYGTSDNYGDC